MANTLRVGVVGAGANRQVPHTQSEKIDGVEIASVVNAREPHRSARLRNSASRACMTTGRIS